MAPQVNSKELKWHNDGHVLVMRLNQSELEVFCTCPGTPDRECGKGDFCIVDYFVNRFGLDCNIGVCPPAEMLEICWAVAGDAEDPELAQVWFVPINDEVFHAWMVSRTRLDASGPLSGLV
jgi:hypothetical protein